MIYKNMIKLFKCMIKPQSNFLKKQNKPKINDY